MKHTSFGFLFSISISDPEGQSGSKVESGETQWNGILWYLAEMATL